MSSQKSLIFNQIHFYYAHQLSVGIYDFYIYWRIKIRNLLTSSQSLINGKKSCKIRNCKLKKLFSFLNVFFSIAYYNSFFMVFMHFIHFNVCTDIQRHFGHAIYEQIFNNLERKIEFFFSAIKIIFCWNENMKSNYSSTRVLDTEPMCCSDVHKELV
jgi:hypothetical protein